MSKPVKDLITREYKDRYGEVSSACVVSVIGLDAISTNKLRGELRSRNLRLQVIKNSLASRAFAGTALAPLGGAFDGPCALVTGEGSAIDIAKTLAELQKTYPKIELRVGILDGDPELIGVEQLARMKGRLELLGEIAGILQGPGGRLAGCLAGPAGRIAGCVKAIVEKSDKTEPAEAQA
ncbi:MAG TPA: 50S ribosomal protein L10 [Phycisphaerae bacterium]|nr:50S ribosomal protein L10 [Phycisphaerae bacterium]